jgi:phage terminase large subunit-like protein
MSAARRKGWAKYVRSTADERAVLNGCTFDATAAEKVVEFFRRFLRHSKGEWAGKPFELIDWQRDDVIYPLFGWRRADGTRRYRKAYIEIPKKNGKSTIASGLTAYLLVADDEMGAEVYSAAADRDQASIVYNEAANMVEASPTLLRRLVVRRSVKTIGYPATKSYYKALSADVPTKEGLNIHGLIFDELHAQQNRDLFETLMYGGAARRQPLFVSITTAGYDKHSICWEQHEYAEKVRDGIVPDDEFFPYIAAAASEDDWTTEATWRKANPSFGITIKADGFASDCREAQESPAKENAFRRYRLNQWTEQDVRWLKMDRWDACGGEPVDPSALSGRRCVLGVDLSTTTDLTALVALFPPTADDPKFRVLCRCWVPAENARHRERRDRVPYGLWAKGGHLTMTDGNVVDYDVVRREVNLMADLFEVAEVAYDPWNATQLATQLQGDGLTMVPIRQGFATLSAPTKELEKLVLSGRIGHGAHPVLRWCASNVTVETDPAGNLKPSKAKSTERIDLIAALITALARASVLPESSTKSVYETRGVITI